METIDVTPLIYKFEEHLRANDRIIFSARFGDGKTFFLKEFMDLFSDKYEFIVLYPVNYQIATNGAVMEYIKRDILFQLILKGYLKPGVSIPDPVLFQWYLSQNTGTIFTDVVSVLTSLPDVDPKWKAALTILMAISGEITKQIGKFKQFKKDIESEEDFNKAADVIETLSCGAGNIYELDLVSYLIIQTIQQIKNQGKETVLVIEDLDRIDPAHLFRILNVFSAHIDRVYQVSDRVVNDGEGNEVPIDTLNNKFGFDKVIMVLDNNTTQYIFNHFYGEHANYQGYISKFISHNVFEYSISKYALQLLVKHLKSKCAVSVDMILSKGRNGNWYIDKEDLSVRKIAQMLDAFDDSISNTIETIEGTQVSFSVRTTFTRTISTLRRLGMNDESIFMLLTEKLNTAELLQLMGGFLMKQPNAGQSYDVYYKGKLYGFHVERQRGELLLFGKCEDRDVRQPEQFKFLDVDIYDAFIRACQYVK